VTWQFQHSAAYAIDLLFVIDDSAAATTLPAAVKDAYPQMGALLQSLTPAGEGVAPGTAPPSLHVAFVPASYAGEGACLPGVTRAKACGLSGSDPFLSTAACGQQPNFAGSLPDAFACMADLGYAGCGRAEPFAAIRRVLAGGPSGQALPEWSGFSREGAQLQIVIVSAEDDASSSEPDVAALVAFLKATKREPWDVSVSVIGPSMTCMSGSPLAAAAPRLSALSVGFEALGLYYPACGDAPVQSLLSLATRINYRISPPCLAGVRDVDPELAGVQPRCAAEEWDMQLDGSIARVPLPSCDTGAPPCWRLSESSLVCPGGLQLDVDHGAGWCVELPTITSISCAGCLDPGDPACAR
jgi:hypothetical protein